MITPRIYKHSHKSKSTILDKLSLDYTLTTSRKNVQRSSRPWYTHGLLEILLIVFFSACDAASVQSLLDNTMLASSWVITLATAGICVLENILASIAGHIWHEVVTLKKRSAKVRLFGAIAVDVTLLTGLLLFRFVSRNATLTTSIQGLTGMGTTVSAGAGDDGTQVALALVLSLIPYVTSVASFLLATCNSPLRRRAEALELEIIHLEETVAQLQAAVAEIQAYDPAQERQLLLQRHRHATAYVDHLETAWKQLARHILAQRLEADPRQLSRLAASQAAQTAGPTLEIIPYPNPAEPRKENVP